MADLAVEVGPLDDAEDGSRAGGRDDELVVRTLHAHAPALLRTARRHSLCADDAHDAYQRALEVFVRRAGSLRRETVVAWLHTVVKHEAMAVRAQRSQLVGAEEADLDARAGDGAPEPQERVERFERTARAAEALASLKPQEVTALWLKAEGLSYTEIAERQAWTYTKVNRCIAEGRKAFLARYAQIESGEECARWEPVLSRLVDGEAAGRDVRAARRHVRRCPACRATLRELHAEGRAAAAVVPLVLGVAPLGGGGGGGSHGVLVRLHEMATALHERLVGTAAQVQATVESASGAKVAAIAASAAAVAGGGAVAAHDVPRRPAHRHVAARMATVEHVSPAAVPPTPSSAPVPTAVLRRAGRRSGRAVTPPAATAPEVQPDAPSVETAPSSDVGLEAQQPAERTPEPRPAAAPAASPPRPAAASSERSSSGEFGVEGG